MDKIKNGLIVSCQALEDEPLNSSYIMGKMALAAMEGGAVGIRANSLPDILEIKKRVNLPIIGIVKRDYSNSEIFITATMKEVDELIISGCDIIALDATQRIRPNNIKLKEFIKDIRTKYPEVLLMADCSSLSDAINADHLGFDYIGTTLVGYTEETKENKIEYNDFEILRMIINKVKAPVIAEGNIKTPEMAKRVLELGAYSVVVGSTITRPQLITKSFVEKINEGE